MKTVIFTHGDSDGLCSGALALAACGDSPVYFTNPVSVLTDIEEARGYDRIVVCDIAINLPRSAQMRDKFESLAKSSEVIYIDHHPLPPGFSAPWLFHDTGASASELTFNYFSNDLSPDMSRVAMYGAIGDYEDMTPGARRILQDWDMRSLYYQAGTLSQGIEIGRRDYEFKRGLVRQLAQNTLPSEIGMLAKNALIAARHEDEMRRRVQSEVVRMKNIAYVLDMNGCMGKAAIFARVYGKAVVGISAEYRDHRDAYDFSARGIGDVDLNIIIGDVASRNGGTGGGHPRAAGGRIPAKNMNQFLLDLDKAIGSAMEK
ncbi:Single-stranded DNA-specific exonuclease (RecJ-like) [Methanocella conradii HZ254]|uniref:Single-stranded DNA-specific exonuclease (RecJ-like) n=1 Tax=Methanocella conradii (strain DSM 24694 / JCM 17849 / CGMCC 1.5162 / HZ254) TaxID=1041930 RepID=H8I5D6_METCZ|nr:DHHA1 domain-containing protein [Methanocella conradii]AFC98830.1 Single-stranded DNA-specific exonuclease (RecJ-like) [Methanocella conradii HZ254]